MIRYISSIAKMGRNRWFEDAEVRNEHCHAFYNDLAHFIVVFILLTCMYRLLMRFSINIELVTHILPKLMYFIVEFVLVQHEF